MDLHGVLNDHSRRRKTPYWRLLVVVVALVSGGSLAPAWSAPTAEDHVGSATALHTGESSGDVSPFEVPLPLVSGPVGTSATSVPFAADGFDPDFPLPRGYKVQEYFVSGRANIYQYTPTGISVVSPCPAIVTGSRMPACSGLPYTTRMLLYSPKRAQKFSGSVWVNPINPSGGFDFQAVWNRASRPDNRSDNYFARRGDAFVAFTSKSVSVDLLKQVDPARYRTLHWPYRPAAAGDNSAPYDGVTYDIAAQVGALFKANRAGSPLRDLDIDHVFETGFSQDGAFTFTQANIFHSVQRMPGGRPIYDGYVTGGFFGQGGYKLSFPIDLNFGLTPAGKLPRGDRRIVMGPRDVPVIKLNTETEIDGFGNNVAVAWRRPDSDRRDDRYREWEVGGSSHDDAFDLIDPGTKTLTGSREYAYDCDHSDAPYVAPSPYPYAYVANAAYLAMEKWVSRGISPARVPRLRQHDLASPSPQTMGRDIHGNPLGGVRTPYLDVPIASYNVVDTPKSAGCSLAGWADPFSAQKLRSLYPTHGAYVTAFAKSASAAVQKGTWTRHDAKLAIRAARAADVP